MSQEDRIATYNAHYGLPPTACNCHHGSARMCPVHTQADYDAASQTTPRKDAIAALAEAIMAAESDDDVPWNERPRPGQVLDNLESLGWRLAALGAGAETPACSICSHGPDPHYTGCMECDRYGRDHTL